MPALLIAFFTAFAVFRTNSTRIASVGNARTFGGGLEACVALVAQASPGILRYASLIEKPTSKPD